MGEQLYNNNTVFKESIDKCDSMLQEYFGYSILQQLRSLSDQDKDQLIHQPILAQPSLFLIQYALIEFLKSWGIQPDAVVGHSFGELTSALCSNIISLSSAVKIVYHRSRCQQKTIGSGRMLSIGIGIEKYNEFKQQHKNHDNDELNDDIEIACFNSPDSIVVTGSEKSLRIIQDQLQEDGIFATMLGTPCSFHSSKQDIIRDEMISILSDLPPSMNPDIPFFSTVTGDQLKGESFFNSEFIFQNLRQPVKFNESILNISKFFQKSTKSTIFIEISPHPTLSFYIPKSIQPNNNNKSKFICLPTLSKKVHDIDNIQSTLSQLYCNGIQLNFNSGQIHSLFSGYLDGADTFNNINNDYKDRVNWIPKYQWDSKEYWNAPKIVKKHLIPPTNLLGQHKSNGNLVLEVVIDLKKPTFQFLKGHISRGQYLFPGCGYIDIILKQYPKQDLTIYNLSFDKPIKISEDIPVILQTSIQSTMTKNEFRIDFYYRYSNSETWTPSCHGRFGLHLLDYSSTQFDISKIQQECSFTTINKKDVYERLSLLGLPYGPSFQKIQSLSIGKSSLLSVIDATNTFDEYYFNASTLDSTSHGGITLLEPPQEIVFESVKNLQYFPSNMTSDQPSILYSYTKAINHIVDLVNSPVYIINPTNGKAIIKLYPKVTSLTREKKSEKTYRIKYPTKNLYKLYWQPKESVLSSPPTNLPPKIDKIVHNNNENQNNDNIIDEINIHSIINQLLNNLNIPKTSKHLIKILYFDNKQQEQPFIQQILSATESRMNDNVEIEFTCFEIEKSIVQPVPNQSKYSKISIKTRSMRSEIDQFDIDKEFFTTSNYDLIVLPLVNLSITNSTIHQIKRLLLPSGWLIIIGSTTFNNNMKTSTEDNIRYSTSNTVSDDKWISNLKGFQCNPLISIFQNEPLFINNNNTNSNIKPQQSTMNYIFISQSPKIEDMESNLESIFRNQNKIIIDCNNQVEFEQFKLNTQQLNDNDLIFFYGCDQHLTKDNYLNVTVDYLKVYQNLHKIGFKGKYILLTINSQGESVKNYLNGSLIGSYKYLINELKGDPYSFDFDEESIKSFEYSQLTRILFDNDFHDKDFIIRNGIVQVQRLFREYQSTTTLSYETDPTKLCIKCDPKLNYQLQPKKSLKPNEIEVQVMAVGINFKDLMYFKALIPQGMYPEGHDLYNPPFGLECAGIVTRIGSDCKRLKIGDKVFGLSQNTLVSHVIEKEGGFILKPDNINWTQAASIPLVYITSNYCLSQLNMARSVLIHSASEGVGLSALNILKWKQFKGKVFVSCGSPEKEEYLRNHYGDIITDYFNSRNHSFSTKIKEQYGGVDFIINTLSGDFLSSNFNCLTEIGRIFDLSVTHLIENETLDLGQFQFSKGYQTLDINIIDKYGFDIVLYLLPEIALAIERNEIDLIPIREFQCNQAKEAIEEIGKSKHIGKLVVNMENLNELVFNPMIQQMNDEHQHIPKDEYQLTNLKETLLITGQTGITIPIIKWILQRCSPELRNIVVLSISPLKWELEWLINYCKTSTTHLRIHFQQCDVSSKDEIKSSLDKIQFEIGQQLKIKSVFHAATIYAHTEFEDIKIDALQYTHKPKAYGAINLHELSLELKWSLDNFILFSSIASHFGQTKDCPYTSANWVLDSLAKYRTSHGLSCTSINFGPLSGGGVVARRESVAKQLKSEGLNALSVPKLFGGFDLSLSNQSLSNFLIVDIDHVKLYCTEKPNRPKIEHFIDKHDIVSAFIGGETIKIQSSSQSIYNSIVSIISNILSIEPEIFNTELKLKEYGIDSLSTSQYLSELTEAYPESKYLFSHHQLVNSTTNFVIQKISHIKQM
ncbi:putative polyketide synthase [Tieghemostelium lacteum]|uniref:Putative polyketide synthase n=1 Tax=Tieghemostelium lacteum TaxID=361077 RepID=A0A152A6W1_TIELA|nr:putative polyketide synthase [Tieghemostelium lacteum]|eukprot:KYR01950.1 putative polyketide synthase [Tieghemostelium lacteum]